MLQPVYDASRRPEMLPFIGDVFPHDRTKHYAGNLTGDYDD